MAKKFKPTYEEVARTMVEQFFTPAYRDVELILGTRLPNVTHYALLGRMDALAADVTKAVADALTTK